MATKLTCLWWGVSRAWSDIAERMITANGVAVFRSQMEHYDYVFVREEDVPKCPTVTDLYAQMQVEVGPF